MRILEEIISDLKDGKQVDYEEARLGCLVFSDLLFLAEGDVIHALSNNKLVRHIVQNEYDNGSGRSSMRHVIALKKTPEDWLKNYPSDNTDQEQSKESEEKLHRTIKRYTGWRN